jgi:hypothetical protein
VKIGYSRPKATRGKHPSGFDEVMVWRPKDLEHIDPKTQVARIAHTVGENKRVQILEEAKKANIRVLNPGPKKPVEVVPEVVTEPTTETDTKTETATEAAAGTTEETAARAEVKEGEPHAEKAPKKRRTSKGSKKRSKK